MDNSEVAFVPKRIDLRKEIIALSEKCLHVFILQRIDELRIGNSWQNGLKPFVDKQYESHPDNMETLHSFLNNHNASDVEITNLDITAIIPLLLYYKNFKTLYTRYPEKIEQRYISMFHDFRNVRNAIRHYPEEILISERENLVLDQMDGICTIIRFSLLCERHCSNVDFWKDSINKAFYFQRILRGELLFLTKEDKETDLAPESNLCEIETEAATGNISAQTLLGKLLYEGNRYECDYDKAFYWFYKAARKDNKEAAYYIGICYRRGLGVDFDYEKGKQWIKKSADLGYPPAMYEIAQSIFCDSTIQDKQELIAILDKLIALNYPPAFWLMAQCYKGGIGVKTDLQKEKELTEKSALLGNTFAAEHLAQTAIKNKDFETAKYWLEVGAAHKSPR